MMRALAHLPQGALYVLADAIYAMLFYVVRYRRRLVRKNLTACFPDFDDKRIDGIERQFYRNFADYIVETVKLLHISDAEVMRRYTFTDIDIVRDLLAQGRTITAYYAHVGNWEWAPSITLHCPEAVAIGDVFAQIYRPLRNRHFDALMLHLRSRFGSECIAKRLALRRLLEMRRDGVTSITGFMSDQKPSHGDPLYVVNFLGRPTAVITGTETLARRLDTAVVYFDVSHPRRGHYNLTLRLMSRNAAQTAPHQLTDQYFRLLEDTIRRNPAVWLWSHNRWKNPIPEDYADQPK